MNSKYKTIKYKQNLPSDIEDLVSIEEPLEMVVRYKKKTNGLIILSQSQCEHQKMMKI